MLIYKFFPRMPFPGDKITYNRRERERQGEGLGEGGQRENEEGVPIHQPWRLFTQLSNWGGKVPPAGRQRDWRKGSQRELNRSEMERRERAGLSH